MIEKITTEILTILEKDFNIDCPSLEDEFISDYGFDNEEFQELYEYINDEYDTKLNNQKYKNIISVEDLINLITNNLLKKNH